MNGEGIGRQHSVMNTTLWALQILWGIFFSFTGFGKILAIDDGVWNQMLHRVAWFSAVPQGLFVFIGIAEFLGGVALIVPAMTGIKPKLTPLAAAGLAVIMVLAAGFHIARGEYLFFVTMNLLLAGVAAFIAYGRWVVRPIEPRPINAFAIVKGLAVWAALAIGGFAPVWLQIAHKG
jgi:hypothetical protein